MAAVFRSVPDLSVKSLSLGDTDRTLLFGLSIVLLAFEAPFFGFFLGFISATCLLVGWIYELEMPTTRFISTRRETVLVVNCATPADD